MKVYRTKQGIIAEHAGALHRIDGVDWDDFLNRPDTAATLQREIESGNGGQKVDALPSSELLAPVSRQEVWAAGVTYFRSRTARMEESQASGGDSFYDRVYDAQRPELFFKSPAWRVIGPEGQIRIRRDSKWNVPEPELALVVNSAGQIIGFTIGNDVSSRDIEGENPLYLPQAKCYDGACALGPGVLLTGTALDPQTKIQLEIVRGGKSVFNDSTTLSQMKRAPKELVEYLYLETTFPEGAVLLTGTGIVPDEPFTLEVGDEVRITIEPIGTLVNRVG